MPGKTLEQAARDLPGPAGGGSGDAEQPLTVVGDLGPEEEGAAPGLLKRILSAQTGPGEISEYQDHPMCYDKSEGLAQIIRGLTGIVRVDLRLAVIDILVGAVRWLRRAPASPRGPAGG